MSSSTDILHLKDVYARYPDNGADNPFVLNGVNFQLPSSSCLVVLTGPNGCGKTTVLRSIIGQLDIEKGTIWYNGKDVTSVPTHRRHGISCIFQRAQEGLCATLTVEENLCLALSKEKLKLSRSLVNRKRHAIILDFAKSLKNDMPSSFISDRLEKSLNKFPNMFSGGELQQICLFAAMIQRPHPHILLADEPTLNLDRSNRKSCLDMLLAISRITTVLIATHDKDLIFRSDNNIIMENGRIVEN